MARHHRGAARPAAVPEAVAVEHHDGAVPRERPHRRGYRAADAGRRRWSLLRPDRVHPRQRLGPGARRYQRQHHRTLPADVSGAAVERQRAAALRHVPHLDRRGRPGGGVHELLPEDPPRHRHSGHRAGDSREQRVRPLRTAENAADEPAPHLAGRRTRLQQRHRPGAADRRRRAGHVEALSRCDRRRQPDHRGIHAATGPTRRRQPERDHPDDAGAGHAFGAVAGGQRLVLHRRRAVVASAGRCQDRGGTAGRARHAVPQHDRGADHGRRREHARPRAQQLGLDVPERRVGPACAGLRHCHRSARYRGVPAAEHRDGERWTVFRDHQGAD